jgi:hypothetical protein
MKARRNRVKKLKGVQIFGPKEPEIRISWQGLAQSFTGNVLLGKDHLRKVRRAFQLLLKTHFPLSRSSAKKLLGSRTIGGAEARILSALIDRYDQEGDRSRSDFYICCVAVQLGISKAALWRRVQNLGKFKERGRDYFVLTYDKAAETVASGLTNAIVVADGKRQGIELTQIVDTLLMLTGGWPRRVGKMLFIHDPVHGIAYLPNPAALFAWLHTTIGQVQWYPCASCVSKEELYQALLRIAQEYDSIQELPHYPALQNYYYAVSVPEPGDGQTFEALIDCFEPATPLDRTLIAAAFLTPFWGGTAGARPLFVITADGRGHGKTALAELIALLYQGCLAFSKGDEASVIIQRLLSPEGLKSRMVLLDNLKSLKFSWAEFEALITAPVISGKAMYIGEARRPNHLTYFLTGNALALSTDVAQRSVIIRLAKPTHTGDWFPSLRDFINEHRMALIADMVGLLQRPTIKLARHSRWGEWEDGVLAKFPDAAAVQRLIQQRRGEADVEVATAAVIEEYVRKRLAANGYDPDRDRIRIPSDIIVEWFNGSTEQNQPVARASAVLRQMADEGQLKHLSKAKSHKHARSFVWTGEDAGDADTVVFERRLKRS